MHLTTTSLYRAYNRKGGSLVARLWKRFGTLPNLPPLDFAHEVSAVYSSSIEGNSLDLNAYINSKGIRAANKAQSSERREIDDLVAVYRWAQETPLTEAGTLEAHRRLARGFVPKPLLGAYRKSVMFVLSGAGIEYAAVEWQLVPERMAELFSEMDALLNARLSVGRVFYHASLLHLRFVHIHPFHDGNGRMARLLEKWFLAQKLGVKAWQIPVEAHYRAHRDAYYANLRQMGANFYDLDYLKSVPFLTMLPDALADSVKQLSSRP